MNKLYNIAFDCVAGKINVVVIFDTATSPILFYWSRLSQHQIEYGTCHFVVNKVFSASFLHHKKCNHVLWLRAREIDKKCIVTSFNSHQLFYGL